MRKTLNNLGLSGISEGTYKNLIKKKFSFNVLKSGNSGNWNNASKAGLLNKKTYEVLLTNQNDEKYLNAVLFLSKQLHKRKRKELENAERKKNNAKPIENRIRNNKTLTNAEKKILRIIYELNNNSTYNGKKANIFTARTKKIINTPGYHHTLTGTNLYDAFRNEAIRLARSEAKRLAGKY